MSRNLTQSASKGKSVGRKDKQQLKQRHRRQMEQAKLLKQQQQAKLQIARLKQTGLVSAYQQFLRNLCKNGLPQPANIYQLAAQFVLKFEKKHKIKLQKKQELEMYNRESIKSIYQDGSRAQSPEKY